MQRTVRGKGKASICARGRARKAIDEMSVDIKGTLRFMPVDPPVFFFFFIFPFSRSAILFILSNLFFFDVFRNV